MVVFWHLFVITVDISGPRTNLCITAVECFDLGVDLRRNVTDGNHLRFKGFHRAVHTEHVSVPLHLNLLCELYCQVLEHLVALLGDAPHQLIHSWITHLVILCCSLELCLVPFKLLLTLNALRLSCRLLQVSNFDPVMVVEQPGVLSLFLEALNLPLWILDDCLNSTKVC